MDRLPAAVAAETVYRSVVQKYGDAVFVKAAGGGHGTAGPIAHPFAAVVAPVLVMPVGLVGLEDIMNLAFFVIVSCRHLQRAMVALGYSLGGSMVKVIGY